MIGRVCAAFLLWAAAAIVLPAQTAPGVLRAPATAIAPALTFTLLHSFDYTDGSTPVAGLVQGTDGRFYGTTSLGGANSCFGDSCGTVFRVTPGGTLTTLHSFDSAGGYEPAAGLVLAIDGNFYGTTEYGGANGCFDGSCGTVFRITPGGTLTTLHSFDETDGSYPYAGLVLVYCPTNKWQ
jgi:uncharacterized repeat protein (TIGR03803 family)